MPQCFINRCMNRTGLLENREKGIAFYALPSRNKSPERYEKWIQFAGKSEEQGKRTFICSHHFKVGDLDESQLLRQRLLTEVGVKISAPQLKEDAIPSVFIKELTDRCYVKDCTSKNSLHPFPHRFYSPERFNSWVAVCNQDAVPGSRSGICDRHFDPADYQKNSKGVNTLKPEAVPKISVKSNKISPNVQKKKEEQSTSIERTKSDKNNKKQTERQGIKKKPTLQNYKKINKIKRNKNKIAQGIRRRGLMEKAILSSRIRKMFYKTLQKDVIIISDDDSEESEKPVENTIVEKVEEEDSRMDDGETLKKYEKAMLDDVVEPSEEPVEKPIIKKEKRNVKQSLPKKDNETSQKQHFADENAKSPDQTDTVQSNDCQTPSSDKSENVQEVKSSTAFPLDLSEILNCRVTVVGEKQEFNDVGIQCEMAPEHSGTIYVIGDKTIIHRDVIRKVVRLWTESDEEEPEEMCTVKLIEKVESEEEGTINGNISAEEEQYNDNLLKEKFQETEHVDETLVNTMRYIKKEPYSEAEYEQVSEEGIGISIKEEPIDDEEHLGNMDGFVYIKCEQNHGMEEEKETFIHEKDYDEHKEYTGNINIKQEPEQGLTEMMDYEEHIDIKNIKKIESNTTIGFKEVQAMNIKKEVYDEHEEYTGNIHITQEPEQVGQGLTKIMNYEEHTDINIKKIESNTILGFKEVQAMNIKQEVEEESCKNTAHEEQYTGITYTKEEPQDTMEYEEEFDRFKNINEPNENSNEVTKYRDEYEYNKVQLKKELQERIYLSSIEIKEECIIE